MSKAYAWPGDSRLAVSIVVNVEEGAEGTIADGDPGPEPVDELGITLRRPVRSYGNESNYQYGIKAGAPRVLAILSACGIQATFTTAALALERAPEPYTRRSPCIACCSVSVWRWLSASRSAS